MQALDLAFSQKDLVRILKQSGQIVPDFLKPLPDGTYKGNKIPRVNDREALTFVNLIFRNFA